MKRVIVTLIACFVASAAFAQAPAKNPQAEPAKVEAAHPVKSTIKPEPDIARAANTEAKTTGESKKVEKHKKPKEQNKAAKSDTAAESKTRPAAETK